MPTINIYYNKKISEQEIIEKLRVFAAKILSRTDIILTPEEISIRFINVIGEMIGDIELEISVQSFNKERVERQDEISNEFRNFLMKEFPKLGDVHVWLKLTELEHGF